MTRQYVAVARVTDVPEGEARTFEVEGIGVAVCRVNGEFFAIEDVCTHDDGPLGEGTLHGFEIECPRHGARFDVRTGDVLRMPAVTPVASFPVKIEEGEILVEVEVD